MILFYAEAPSKLSAKTRSASRHVNSNHERITTMTTEDREMLEHLSDQNMLHMQQGEQLSYLLEWIFKHTDTLVDGTTKAQVDEMTLFQKIELLEHLWEHPKMFGHEMLRDIGQFVEEIKPYKDGFRTAYDFKRVTQ